MFYGLRILSGIGLGASYPLLYSSVGNIGGTLIGGYLGANGNWRLPFLVASLPNALLIIIYLFLTPEPKKAASEEATREFVAAGLVYPRRLKLADYRGLFTSRTNLYLFLQGIAGTIPWGAFFFINEYPHLS